MAFSDSSSERAGSVLIPLLVLAVSLFVAPGDVHAKSKTCVPPAHLSHKDAMAYCKIYIRKGEAAAKASLPAPPEYPEAERLCDEAEAQLSAGDFASASETFVRCRGSLLRAWIEGHDKGGYGNSRFLRASGRLGSDRFHPAVETLLWRTFLGRKAALDGLGHALLAAAERPLRSIRPEDCPEDLRDRCSAHLQSLQDGLGDIIKTDEKGAYYGRVAIDLSRSPDSADTQLGLTTLSDRLRKLGKEGYLQIALQPSKAEEGPSGFVTLSLRGGDIGFSSGSDCEKRLGRVEGDKVWVETWCKDVKSSSIHAPDLVVHAHADAVPPRLPGDVYYLLVDKKNIRISKREIEIKDAWIAQVHGKKGKRYVWGVDLSWSL